VFLRTSAGGWVVKQHYEIQISLTLVGNEKDIDSILKEVYELSNREEVTAMRIEEIRDYRRE